MKILHVLQSASYSGAENVVIQVIKMINSYENVESIYASTKGKIEEALKNNKIDYMLMDKFDYKNLKKIINEFDPDVIHAHDFQASILCTLLKKDRTLISHIHSNPDWIKKINLRSLIYLICSIKINKILTVSPKIVGNYVFGKLIKNKALNIGNPINSEKIRSKSTEIINNIDKDHISDLIFVGRLEEVKNPFRFIDIVNKVKLAYPSVKAVMVGNGSLLNRCEEYINELELNDNIKILGFQENPYSYIKNSKVLCITSRNEGYSLVAIEAISLSIPVVSVDVGEVSSIVDSSSGLVINDEQIMIDEIVKLLHDKAYYMTKSKGAFDRSNVLSNYEKFRETLYSLYINR